MVNKKIKVIAKIERDAQNLFFVKILYGFTDSKHEPDTVYTIEDSRLLDNLIGLSYMALENFPVSRDFGYSIVIYDPETKDCYSGPWTDYKVPTKIIVGTDPRRYFDEINYLIQMLSKTIEENNMGELWVQYGDKLMTEEEFYEFQKELSIYTV